MAQLLHTQTEQDTQSHPPVSTENSSDTSTPSEATLVVLTVKPRVSSRSSRRLMRRRSSALLLGDGTQSQASLDSETAAVPQPQGFTQSLEGLKALVQPDVLASLPVSFQVRQGRPATEILNYANTIQAGLIAVGHRGSGGIRELLLGSVSTVIARYAPCSVLVARGNANRTGDLGLTHVLVVVDGSLAARPAIATTRQLLPSGIQRITILYIQHPPRANYLLGPFASQNPSWQLDQSLQDAQKEKTEQMLKRTRHALEQENLEIQTRTGTGDPGPLICQVAEAEGVDLVVVGNDPTRRSLLPSLPILRHPKQPKDNPSESHRRLLRNTRLSAAEDYVIHYAPCPVLLCRSTR